MTLMFADATRFNRDINLWNISLVVEDMRQMFDNAISFNNGGNPLMWDIDPESTHMGISMFRNCPINPIPQWYQPYNYQAFL